MFLLYNNNNNNNKKKTTKKKEHWYKHASSSLETVYESKVTILGNQHMKIDRNMSNKPDVLICIELSGDTKASKTEVFRNLRETRR